MAVLLNDKNILLNLAPIRVLDAAVVINPGTTSSLVLPKNSTSVIPSGFTLTADTSRYISPVYSWSYRVGTTNSFTNLGTTKVIAIICDSTFLASLGTNSTIQYKVDVTEGTVGTGINASSFTLSIPIIREGLNGLNSIVLHIYSRNSSTILTPSFNPGTLTYTFASNSLSSTIANWSTSIPSSTGGTIVWTRQTFVSDTQPTSTILDTDWSTPTILVQDGEIPDISNLLTKAGENILTGTIEPQTSGAIKTGTITWDPTTGGLLGGTGVAVTKAGIIGAQAGVSTFTLKTTGDAFFGGDIATKGKAYFEGRDIVNSALDGTLIFSIDTFFNVEYTSWNLATSAVSDSENIRVGSYNRADAPNSMYNIAVYAQATSGVTPTNSIGVLGEGGAVGGYFVSHENGGRAIRARNLYKVEGTLIGGVAIECDGSFMWGNYTYAKPSGIGNFLKDDGTWASVLGAGTAATVTDPAQPIITSVGTLTSVKTSGELNFNDTGLIRTVSLVTSTTSANQVLDTNPISSYRVASYKIIVTSTGAYEYSDITLMQDGSNVYVMESGTMNSGADLAVFTADISGGNMRLLTTPTNAVTTYKIIVTLLAV